MSAQERLTTREAARYIRRSPWNDFFFKSKKRGGFRMVQSAKQIGKKPTLRKAMNKKGENPDSQRLPGVEESPENQERHKDLEAAVRKWRKTVLERVELTNKETECYDNVDALMNSYGLDAYTMPNGDTIYPKKGKTKWVFEPAADETEEEEAEEDTSFKSSRGV